MTRKRFVKLLMSSGYSRNEANNMAYEKTSAALTYDDKYFAVKLKDGDPDAVEVVADAIKNVAEAVNALIPVIVEAINTAIPYLIEAAKEIQRRKEELYTE